MKPKLPHEIVTVVGRTGCGKTQLIAKRLGPRHARRITLDSTGECEELYPRAFRAFGLTQVLDALESWHAADLRAWHLIATLTHEEVGKLVRVLAPPYDGQSPSLSLGLGGVCLEMFEVDMYVPNSGSGNDTGRALLHAIVRGRHVGLSILGATQRPSQCHRSLTSQSHYVVSFAVHEPRDKKWLQEVGGDRFAEIAAGELGEYESVWLNTRTGEITVRDRRYVVRETVA